MKAVNFGTAKTGLLSDFDPEQTCLFTQKDSG